MRDGEETTAAPAAGEISLLTFHLKVGAATTQDQSLTLNKNRLEFNPSVTYTHKIHNKCFTTTQLSSRKCV